MKDIAELVLGYRAFVANEYQTEASRYQTLAEKGQSPRSMVVACCDSRVDPSRIFSALPGELFVVRNVANLVPPFEEDGAYHGTSAALEFAVEFLHIENIIVLGHARCGGVRSFVDHACAGRTQSGFIGAWVSLLEPAWSALKPDSAASRDDICQHLEWAGIEHSLANLRTFPFIERATRDRGLRLRGAYFDISTGCLLGLEPGTLTFAPIT